MRRVQYSDAPTVLKSNHLYCGKKKNKPRVHHLICESNCRYIKRCIYYKAWAAITEEKEVKKAKPKKKRKATRRRKKTI